MKGILKGLGVTFSTFSRKPVTVEYPDVKHPLPTRQRSFPVLLWDFVHDEPQCTGCNVCIRNCPVDCMTATMHDNPKYAEGTSNRRKIVEKFWIDYGRCMRCNICVEVCPFEAIVMDNSWAGPERTSYDRRDLHMDIDDLLYSHKTGLVIAPYRPQDSIELLEKQEKGETPEPSFLGTLPADRSEQQSRIARGEGAAKQEREPEAPKVTAKAASAGAGGEEVEILSESKIRAKRMRAEREAKEFTDRGEAVPQEILDRIAHYSNMKPGEAAAAPGGAAGGGTGELLTGLMPDGSMRFPPGIGDGPKGDPNSAEKVKARRMRAERKFNELKAAGEPIPDDVAQTLYDLGSDLAPNGTIWATLAGAGGGAASAGAAPAAAAPGGDGGMVFPPGIGIGPKGDPNSYEKVRARRMRAEKKAAEAVAAGEPVPDDIAATIRELGGTVPGAG